MCGGRYSNCPFGPGLVPTALYIYGRLGCLEENFSSQFFNRVSDDVNYFVATQYRLSRCAVWWQRRRGCGVTTAALSHSFAPLRLYAAAAPPLTTTAEPPRRCCWKHCSPKLVNQHFTIMILKYDSTGWLQLKVHALQRRYNIFICAIV